MAPPAPPGAAVANERVVRLYDRLSRPYDVFVGPLQSVVRSQALDFLALEADDHVLDVGCGPGHALVEISSRTSGGHVCGLDAAAGMIQRARRRCGSAVGSDRVSLFLGDARALPFRDGAFDAVFLEATLELFSPAEMHTVLEEIARVLSTDGRLCVVTMEREEHERSRFVRLYDRLFEWLPGYRYVGCRPVYARRALEEAGFSTVQSVREYHAGGWPADIYLVRPGQ